MKSGQFQHMESAVLIPQNYFRQWVKGKDHLRAYIYVVLSDVYAVKLITNILFVISSDSLKSQANKKT